ncbi:DctP family TRAP transporter solute-binding subunit [Sutcliffiella halmapala]|uniref:DctP family TRAP transporter solute-binding subunit n=1 Tax=Sutcliffiella halmapala TaxID=79882 RepID=UPI0009953855|nr:DctP family TRAP transporter solute-binding subunit [Sutcliffiella halmapala]
MKSTYSFILLFSIVATVFIFGFLPHFTQEELPYDDDQEGLSKQIVFKFSHVVAENTPKGLAAAKFAKLVSDKSNGNIKIEIFPNGSLYSDIEEINALKEGHVHFIAPSTSKLGMLSPKWGVLDLPFAFPSDAAITEGLNGPIGTELLHSLQRDDIKGLAHWRNGFKQLTTNKGPLITPQDIEGQTFRIMQSGVLQQQFDRLNSHAIQESFNSTYKLLESGKVDGEENTISNIYSKKFYNLQEYLTISNHGYLGYAVMMSEKVWEQQTEETKRILIESMEETTSWNTHHSIKMNNEQLDLIKEKSPIKIYELTEQEKEQWKKVLDPVYDTLTPQIGKELVDEIKKLRKRYE